MKFLFTCGLLLTSLTTFAAQLETIIGYSIDKEGITFQVNSGGCTKKEDFTLLQLEKHPLEFKLMRKIPDFCEAIVLYGTKVQFTWEELKLRTGDQFVVTNPNGVITVHK